ncbi:type II toxin-antitoxin system HicB family antitoxin [Cereibacter sphaeroides]|uniref:peptidyl-tRNA hydrolase n=1 Tax=Cereibacter sphaeroides TaxID=1063 RepID=UPI001F37EEB3|nr:peptidyl-tRNA hydrolase [Cereibacter sphaeroides]MCE6959601.1 type II toxin-antitoxin system HicB family antitoxin [Cereibacter sphaeroides]MCE6974539.1 type II toxin-antitoxin system HicB family antitoxin [Cereibacter sphaeroides]
MLPYRVLLEPLPPADGRGWLATFPDLPGCMSDGDTPEEALAQAKDALSCWLEVARERETILAGLDTSTRVAAPGQQEMKQVILIRRDLGMRRGKEIAQGAHASMLTLLTHRWDPRMVAWLSGPFAKIALSVDGEAELLGLADQAEAAGLIVARIRDAGRTEFRNVPTWTTVAIGPDYP